MCCEGGIRGDTWQRVRGAALGQGGASLCDATRGRLSEIQAFKHVFWKAVPSKVSKEFCPFSSQAGLIKIIWRLGDVSMIQSLSSQLLLDWL